MYLLRKICIHSYSNTLKYSFSSNLTNFSQITLLSTHNNTKPKFSKNIQRQKLAEKFVLNSPAYVQPYLRLSRLNAPIGSWLLFWPCSWGLVLGSSTGIPPIDLISLFGLGTILMRGAGCTINDIWDHKIDSSVSRTQNRPLASKELTIKQGLTWFTLQLSLSFAILLYLPSPCLILGISSLALVVLYPLAKRVTNWPQFVLGSTFNFGILFGYTSIVSTCPSTVESLLNFGPFLEFPWATPSVLSLYLGAIVWTLLYDTIYAHQDREEDALLGLGSTARCLGDNTKTWLTGFSTAMISLWATTGYLESLSWPYYVGLSAISAHLAWQILTLDINSKDNCAKRFRSNHQIGWMLAVSILAAKFVSV